MQLFYYDHYLFRTSKLIAYNRVNKNIYFLFEKNCAANTRYVHLFTSVSGFFIPFNFLPDLAKDLKLDKTQGALLISIIGVSNTVARLVVGFVTDRPWANSLVINNLALMIGGITTFAVPFYNSFAVLTIYSIVFGASIGVYVWSTRVCQIMTTL